MVKPKIAISLDEQLLTQVDAKVDGSIIRSRSQAVEYLLRKGLKEEALVTGVLLLKGEHQQKALSRFKDSTLLRKQLEFFRECGLTRVHVVTQHTSNMSRLLEEISSAPVSVELVESPAKGNAKALASLKGKLDGPFLVMSGDTYNHFDLSGMIKKHRDTDVLAVMGLMTRPETASYGTAILDGDYVVDFQEKPRKSSTNIVNAGIYLFKPEVFELFDGVNSLEKDLFPKLARMKQLVGFFTYGEYEHFG